jgi:uncharacterized protein involved in outer membrane biogenesis
MPSPASSSGPRLSLALRLLLIVAASVIASLVILVLAVSLIDWNRARPWVNERVSAVTGRHFAIQGDLDAQWVWPQALDAGWRRWVPGVLVQAEKLELGNRPGFGPFGALDPDDARSKPPHLAAPEKADADEAGAAAQPDDAPLMARVGHASASLRLLPLLRRLLWIDALVLSTPDVALARRADGENNWSFPRQEDGEASPSANPWRVELNSVSVEQGQLAYADVQQQLALRAKLATEDVPAGAEEEPRYGLRFELLGRFRAATVSGQGRAGQLLSVQNERIEYPIEFDARAGATRAQVRGTLSNPRRLSGLDLQVTLEGQSMADLYELTGLVLPNTPPYKTSGHLVGSLEPERATWDYEDFTGAVGKSDLEGHLTYTSGQPRPRLTGQLKSRKLQLGDLGPVVGTPEGAGKEKIKTTRPGKVLPDDRFATGRWDAMDADVAFLGQRLVGPAALPLDNFSVRAILKEGQLRLTPLRFGVAKGRIDAQVVLDSHSDPLKAQIRATVDDLKLSSLFPKVELMDKSLGRMDGAFALAGEGTSIASMLATSTGEARFYVRDGTLSKQLLDLAALNLGSVIVAKLFGEDKEVHVRCAVADLAVKDGMAQTRSVKLSTNEAVVEAVGTIDFDHEHLDLRIKPESLEWKFFSLRTPLTVRGPFIDPQIGVEAGPLLARAGAAVLAAVAAPAALALVPITVPAAEDDAHCAKLLARADEAVKAGPAGAAPKPGDRR